jgi:hypothetical protein
MQLRRRALISLELLSASLQQEASNVKLALGDHFLSFLRALSRLAYRSYKEVEVDVTGVVCC